MDRTDSEAPEKLDQMLAKELFELKEGTLICGLKICKDTKSFGRCASFNVDGGLLTKGLGKQKLFELLFIQLIQLKDLKFLTQKMH